jgi:hypothetical protein
MQDAVIAAVLCFLGLSAIVVAAIFAFKQKTYVDSQTKQVTKIEVPLFGKLTTNTPAIALCFLGAVFGFFAFELMKDRAPQLVPFHGEISLDGSADPVGVVMVGLTSGSWIQSATPAAAKITMPVDISAPNSWPSYTAFALAVSGGKTRAAMIGSSLENPTFKLSIQP